MDTRNLSAEAKSWLKLFCSETGSPEYFADGWSAIQREIAASGSYGQTFDEIEYGAKIAWRNSTRCVGRLHWQNLLVRNCRQLRSAADVFESLVEHIRISTGAGSVTPVITLFAPATAGRNTVRIWNRQLIGYAGDSAKLVPSATVT
jgi:nitric-oxide synthase, bacterial